jgi:D-alanyl-D-alanine carboxypeptidase
MAATMTPGALVGVWYPGQGTWTKAAGIGDLATGAPVTLGDHVRIASNTKTFVGVVVLQLVDEGEIGLDDPLERYVPGIPNGDEITIRQVLGMTAGVYNFVRDPRIAEGYAADPLLPFTPEDALEIIRDSSPDYAPGTSVQYSDSNYILLGFVVEAVTGRPLGQRSTNAWSPRSASRKRPSPTPPRCPSPRCTATPRRASATRWSMPPHRTPTSPGARARWSRPWPT